MTPAGSELRAHTKLVTPVDHGPARVPVNRCGSRSRRRVTEYLLLVHQFGVQQVGGIQRQLDVRADGVADGAVQEPRCLLENRQSDTAIGGGRGGTRAPVKGEPQSDWPLFIEPPQVVGISRDSRQ